MMIHVAVETMTNYMVLCMDNEAAPYRISVFRQPEFVASLSWLICVCFTSGSGCQMVVED